MRSLALALLAFLLAGCPAKRVEPTLPLEQRRTAINSFNKGVRLLQGRGANYYEAVGHFEAAVGLDPDFYEAHFNLGLLFARGGDFARSVNAYRAALKVKPGDRAASFNLAQLYLKHKRYDSAITILAWFVKKDPADHDARNNLAVLFRMKGKYQDAIDQARYVLDRKPEQVLAYNNLATIFSEQRRHEMANDLFRRALKLDPDNPRVLNNQGLAHLNADRVQEALEHFLKAYEKNKKLEESGLNAASIYMDSADYGRAAAMYKRMVQHIPGFLPALVGHAVAVRGLGKYKDAEQSYQQILGLDRTNPDTLFNLGLLYMNFREKPKWACEAFQRYLKSGRTTPDLQKKAEGFMEDIKLSNPKACGGK
jgi:tetratricopeptide (TPR) repeat protein